MNQINFQIKYLPSNIYQIKFQIKYFEVPEMIVINE